MRTGYTAAVLLYQYAHNTGPMHLWKRMLARSRPTRIALAAPLLAVMTLVIDSGEVGAHASAGERIARATDELAHDPAAAPLYLKRARLHRRNGDLAAALADHRRARSLDPTLDGLALLGAELDFERGRLNEARTAVDQALAGDPGCFGCHLLDARIAIVEGRPLEGAAALGRAIACTPAPRADLYLEQARLLVDAGLEHRGRALDVLERGLSRLGPAVVLVDEAIRIELDLDRVDAALERLELLSSWFERQETILARRAAILHEAGRLEEAHDAYQPALTAIARLAPHHQRAPAISKLEREIADALSVLP